MRAHHSLKNRERKGGNKKNTSRRLKKEMRGGSGATGESSINTSWKYNKEEDKTTLKEFITKYEDDTNMFVKDIIDTSDHTKYKQILENLNLINVNKGTDINSTTKQFSETDSSLITIQNYILDQLNQNVSESDIIEYLFTLLTISGGGKFVMRNVFTKIVNFTFAKNTLMSNLKREMNTSEPNLKKLTKAYTDATEGITLLNTKIKVGNNLFGNPIKSESDFLEKVLEKIETLKTEIETKKEALKTKILSELAKKDDSLIILQNLNPPQDNVLFGEKIKIDNTILGKAKAKYRELNAKIATKKKQLTEDLNRLMEGDSLDTLTTTFEEAQNTKLYGVPLKIDHTTLGKVEDKIKQFKHDIEKKKKELEGLINQEMEKENPDLKTLKSLKERVKTESIVHGESIRINDLNTQLDAKIIAIDHADNLKKHQQSLKQKEEEQAKLLESRKAEKRRKSKEAKQKREKRERRIERRRRAIVSAARDFKKKELINAIKEQIDSNDIYGMIEAYENAINVGTSDNPFSPNKIDPTILKEKKKIIETKIKEQFENDFDKETNLEEKENKIQNMKDNNRLDRYFVDVKNKCIKEAEQKLIRAKDEAEAEKEAAAQAKESQLMLNSNNESRAAERLKAEAKLKAEKEADAELLKAQQAAASKAQVKEQDTTTEPTIEHAAKKAAIAVAAAAAAVVKHIASESKNKLGSFKAASDSDSKREYKTESPDSDSDEEIDPAVKKKTKEAAAQVAIAVAAATAAATKAIATKAIAENELLAAEKGDKVEKTYIILPGGQIIEHKIGETLPNGTHYKTNCHTVHPHEGCKVWEHIVE